MRFVIWICTVLLAGISKAQVVPVPAGSVDSLMAEEKRPLLVLLTADWCRYCDMQKGQLRKNSEFHSRAGLFYYVEFHAESREDIILKRQLYQFSPAKGVHELARALNGAGEVSFPAWVLLDRELNVIFRYKGVLSRRDMDALLQAIDAIGP